MTGAWSATPIVVLNRYMDVLAANPLAEALSLVYTVGTNTISAASLDEDLRALYANREEMTVRAVAGLRALTGPDTREPRVVRLVHELSTRSEEFRRLWARHDVSPGGHGASRLNHSVFSGNRDRRGDGAFAEGGGATGADGAAVERADGGERRPRVRDTRRCAVRACASSKAGAG